MCGVTVARVRIGQESAIFWTETPERAPAQPVRGLAVGGDRRVVSYLSSRPPQPHEKIIGLRPRRVRH